MSSPRSTRVVVAVASSLFAVSALAACSSGGSDSASGSSGGGSKSSSSTTVKVTLAQSGCTAESESYDAGALTFQVANTDATGATEIELRLGERIIGEKENLPPGFSGSFSLQVDPGDYTLYCPGTDKPQSTITITGTKQTSAATDTSALLTQGATDYGQYIELQSGLLVENTAPLVQAIQSGDVDASKTAYAKARAYYERIEPVAESFTSGDQNLDADIDARQGDVPDADWRGFHVIEQGLWVNNSTAGLDSVATELQANVTKLQGLVKGLIYQPAEIANGAVSLLDEVALNKVTGEEERYSHIDLLDFASNVEGAQQAFANLEPGLTKIDPTITSTIDAEFTACLAVLDKYTDAANPSGYVYYNQLTPADVTALSQAVQALQEPLSQVAGKVVTAS